MAGRASVLACDSNAVLSARARRHAWSGEGTLSLKSFAGGSALYDVGKGRFRVDPGAYLLVNGGQSYSIEIDSVSPVSSFCLFFKPGFAEDVKRTLTSSVASLLDCPDPSCEPLSFFERTYVLDPVMSERLDVVRRTSTLDGSEAGMFGVVRELLIKHERLHEEVARVPAAKASTRVELYRRLHRAHGYIDACFRDDIRLDDIARVACLSPNHLLRSFRGLFEQTPHKALTTRRLREARHLLVANQMSVTQICYEVGFDSPGSFSTLFKTTFGQSPKQFRESRTR